MDPTTVPRAAIEAATEAATAVVIQCPFWVDGCRCRDGAHNDDAQMAASLAAAAPLLVAAERARLVALAGSNGLAANRLRGLTADLVGATAERDLDQVQKIWPIWFEALDTLLAAHGAAVERAWEEAEADWDRLTEWVREGRGPVELGLTEDGNVGVWSDYVNPGSGDTAREAVRAALAARRPDA